MRLLEDFKYTHEAVEPDCLKYVIHMVSKRLVHVSHVSCFSFSIYFSSTPLPSSRSLCICFSLPSPLPAFLCPYLSSATHLPTLSTLSSVFPTVSFSETYFFLSCLSLCLAANLPAPSATLLLTSCSILSSFTVSTSHNYHPTFHGKVSLLFPSLKLFSRFF